MANQHDTYESPEKLSARAANVELYRRLTGRYAIPADRQYVTLAARQSDRETSEINQMLALGLITSKSQFVGVDMVAELIEFNRVTHPEAVWVHQQTTWLNTLLEIEPFNPGVIYLDTEYEGRRAAQMAAETMSVCSNGVVLLVNTCASSPYRKVMDSDGFLNEMTARVPDIGVWTRQGVEVFEYSSNATLMRTFAFVKEELEVVRVAFNFKKKAGQAA